jgi:uncharacterized membrane protein YphA (DoxX/SURF4 family)
MSNSTQQSRALVFIRIAAGLFFLIFAEYKLASSQFIETGMATYIHHFVDKACYPFMKAPLRSIILPHTVFFGAFVAVSELLVGLSLVTGVLVRWASFGGLLMMCLFLFSADYPGPHSPLWTYFGASLDHSVFIICFIALIIAPSEDRWALHLHRSKR